MTCSAVRRAAVSTAVLAVLSTACASTDSISPERSAADLTNPLLSPAYSQWLVGPIAEMASREEAAEYIGLGTDEAAAAFIEAFWERRKPYPLRPDNPLRKAFDARSAEADRLYSEAGYLGRRTARGTVYVLFGPPQEVDFQLSPHPDDPPVEVWRYAADAEPGLHGQPPQQIYRFVKRGDVTETYRPRRTPVSDRPGTGRPGVPGPDFPGTAP